MEGEKNEGAGSKEQLRHSLPQSANSNSDKSQLETAYELGLAGLRQYLKQLRPEQRSKFMAAISENIEKY